jgi:hypothetical protein
MDLTGRAKKRQKQWLRPLFNILNKNNKKNIALILASVNVISFLYSVPIFIERYHERRRKTQRNLSNPLSYKEGATFYFMLNYLAFKIDITRILQSISQTFS